MGNMTSLAALVREYKDRERIYRIRANPGDAWERRPASRSGRATWVRARVAPPGCLILRGIRRRWVTGEPGTASSGPGTLGPSVGSGPSLGRCLRLTYHCHDRVGSFGSIAHSIRRLLYCERSPELPGW